jgi:hypothetical protein
MHELLLYLFTSGMTLNNVDHANTLFLLGNSGFYALFNEEKALVLPLM